MTAFDDLQEDTGRGQAVLERDEVPRVMAVARKRSPLDFAVVAWLYEFGARASEIGLQRLRSVDLRAERGRPVHLKGGQARKWHRLLPFCIEALPAWLGDERAQYIRTAEQDAYLFPGTPGRCYECRGTGKRTILKREGKRRFAGETAPCHHCGETGRRWGISRIQVHKIASDVLKAARIDGPRCHPHVFRHSIITHLLDSGVSPKLVQDRVGHVSLATTLGYVGLTKRAQEQLVGALGDIYGADK